MNKQRLSAREWREWAKAQRRHRERERSRREAATAKPRLEVPTLEVPSEKELKRLAVQPASGIADPAGDARYVVGATCNWHGPIQGTKPFDASDLMPPALREMIKHLEGFIRRTAPEGATDGISMLVPVCPWCTGPLWQVESAAAWWEYWDAFAVEEGITPYYREWLESVRRRHCVPFSKWNGKEEYAAFVKGLAIQ
jgi:hypothetical protein